MFRNFLISAFRNLVRNKFQSIIQILSLSIGLTIFALVVLYLYDELTVDGSNPDKDRVFRIEIPNQAWGFPSDFPYLAGSLLQNEIPEIHYLTRLTRIQNDVPVTRLYEDGETGTQVRLKHSKWVDTNFLKIFPQKFLLGDPATSLTDPNSVILTESVAEKLFGNTNPLGKTVYFWTAPRIVSGVIRDPENTHISVQCLNSHADFGKGREIKLWMTQPTYITLHEHTDKSVVEKKIQEIYQRFIQEHTPAKNWVPEVYLCPLKEVHFSVHPVRSKYMTSTQKNILLNFFLLGLVILAIGIINYVNLTTARASLRRKETALRIIVGSTRYKLILYFLTETLITTMISFLVAITSLQLLFPQFTRLLAVDVNLYFLRSPVYWFFALMAILVISLISGIYPAVRMSAGSTVEALKSRPSAGPGGILTRRILLTLQFSLAIVMMIGIMSMHLQIRYMKNQDPGFDSEGIVWIMTGMNENFNLRMLSVMERIPAIEKTCLSEGIPGNYVMDDAEVDAPSSLLHGMDVDFIHVSADFFRVYDINLTYGSELLERSDLDWRSGDTSYNIKNRRIKDCVINETCRKALKLEDPIGTMLAPRWRIAGVCEDFHAASLQHPVKPMWFRLNHPGLGWILSMKIRSSDIYKTFQEINDEVWAEFDGENSTPDILRSSLDFKFFEDSYYEQYAKEDRIYESSVYMFIMAMVIACLGLLGLSTFMAQRRTKEIGIRKALGSSERQVFMLLARDFLIWVGLSILIGCPVGWYAMRTWQKQFAYKADIGLWIYLLVAVIAIAIALLTVARQSLKTARTNPADSLRYE